MVFPLLKVEKGIGSNIIDAAQWLFALTVNASTATVLGSIPASAGTVVLNIVHKNRPNGLNIKVCYTIVLIT